jgi:hypothetical protein
LHTNEKLLSICSIFFLICFFSSFRLFIMQYNSQ